jgi:hypothetical protein
MVRGGGHAAIVAGNFTRNTTGGLNDATRAKASRQPAGAPSMPQ